MPSLTILQALELARQHHQAGRLRDAEPIYRQILTVAPRHAEAMHLLGLLALQCGQLAVAVDLIGQAVAIDASVADYHNNLGLALFYAGQFTVALGCYERALALQPDRAEIYGNLGLTLAALRKWDDAIGAYRRALELKPDGANTHNNLGLVLAAQKKWDDAVYSYQRALQLNPALVEAQVNLAAALREQGQLEAAAAACRAALQIQPQLAAAHNNLGLTLDALGQPEEALACYEAALRIQPDFAEAHHNLGNLRRARGELEAALVAYGRALEAKPDFVETHNNIGNVRQDQSRWPEAIAAYERAIALQPGYVEAWTNLGNALAAANESDAAVAAYRRALELEPEFAEAHNNLGNVLKDRGETAAALASYDRAIALRPENPLFHSSRLFLLNLHPAWNAPALLAEHRQWDARHERGLRPSIPHGSRDRDPARRLKVGYVSPDLRGHSVARFLRPLLENHDHQAVEVFCYADVAAPDAVTAKLRADADQWRSTVGCSDTRLAEWIRADEIDLLVDLAGHTERNRLLTFARRPAPIQITWLGYANTTGLKAMDFRLTDAFADPPGETEAWYNETLFRLPQTAWCYSPPLDSPTPPPRVECDGPITFGSLNTLGKVTDPMLRSWARILHAVPDSRLLIKARGLGSESVRERMRSLFVSAGIERTRLDLRGPDPSYASHLAAYQEIDIALDTFPGHGTTTTCETLWMNVPVVSLAGSTPASRVGVSLLSNAGLSELIARTEEEYVRIAADLAKDRPRLREWHAALRLRLQASPLMNGAAFARDMEAAYRAMWQQHAAQR